MSVRRSIGQRESVIFFEVPNVLYTLRDLGIWDLIYEHFSYFSQSSLARLFSLSGFDVLTTGEVYAGQFLTIEANPARAETGSGGEQGDLAEMTRLADAFAESYRHKAAEWQSKLAEMSDAGKKTVIWGGGSKGVTFLNVLKTRDKIQYVVDINLRKQGMFIAGTGQEFVPPDFLCQYQPDAVIIMNPVYKDEIRRTLSDLGLTPELLLV